MWPMMVHVGWMGEERSDLEKGQEVQLNFDEGGGGQGILL